jgi:hypothetical protein
VLESDLQRRPVERAELRSRVAHEDVEHAELPPYLVEHPMDVFGTCHVGLDHEALGAACANLPQRLVRGVSLRVVMHGDVDAALGKLQRDASTDPPRASCDQRVFPLKCHVDLLNRFALPVLDASSMVTLYTKACDSTVEQTVKNAWKASNWRRLSACAPRWRAAISTSASSGAVQESRRLRACSRSGP